MLAVIFALVSFVGWGSGDVFTTTASRKMGSYNASFYSCLFGTILSTFFLPFFLSNLHTLTLPMVVLTIILSLFQMLAFLSYTEGLKIGNSSLVGTIAGSFTSVVVILSLLFLGEKLSIQQGIAIVIIFIGLILSSIAISDLRNKKNIINKGTVFALLTMLGWAIYFTFIKLPVKQSGFFWPSYITNVVETVGFFIFGLNKITKPKLHIKSGLPAVFISGTLLTIASFAFNYAIGKGLSSIVAPIAGAYPALFALLAYVIFKDPLTKQQKFGMVTTLIGIIVLAFLGSS